ncbi:alpha/beta hydrolase [bacterium]|nr:alpha/beta hydrolase [bacterium]
MDTAKYDGEPRGGDVIVNGLRLHYLDWGGDGPPILFLHATGFLGRIYAPILRELRRAGHVYSYDQRGHGESELPRRPIDGWHTTADDLEGFIDAMGWKTVRGIGHSAGATAFGAVGSRRPELIARVVMAEPVILDPTTPPARRPTELRERTLKRKRTFDSVEAMFENFRAKPPCDTWRAEILRDYCEFGTFETHHGARSLRCSPEIEARVYETSRDFDGLGLMLKCPAPMLVLFGEKSDSPGILLADRVRREAARARVEVIPETSHFMPMEQPELVARKTLEFFAAG